MSDAASLDILNDAVSTNALSIFHAANGYPNITFSNVLMNTPPADPSPAIINVVVLPPSDTNKWFGLAVGEFVGLWIGVATFLGIVIYAAFYICNKYIREKRIQKYDTPLDPYL